MNFDSVVSMDDFLMRYDFEIHAFSIPLPSDLNLFVKKQINKKQKIDRYGGRYGCRIWPL